VPQFVQFPGIKTQGAVTRVSLWKKYFYRALDTGTALTNQVDLTFPSRTQQGDHLVFSGQTVTTMEIKTPDSRL
jgi:hypothetical protein